jgi:chloramphenicol 3-O phosphotransferase
VRPAPVVVLNGVPRSGKSSVANALGDGWVRLGVDLFDRAVVPRRHRPGIGLRPGGERPDLEPLLPALYAALFGSVAAHSRRGRPVVVDVGVHDDHSRPLGLRALVASRLASVPAVLVGVRCPLDEVVRRRERMSIVDLRPALDLADLDAMRAHRFAEWEAHYGAEEP